MVIFCCKTEKNNAYHSKMDKMRTGQGVEGRKDLAKNIKSFFKYHAGFPVTVFSSVLCIT